MNHVSTIATGLGVLLTVTAGAFLGTFGHRLMASDDGPAPVPLAKQVELLPVSVAVYSSGERLGYCIVNSRARLENNYSDRDYQNAITHTADRLIKLLSTTSPGADPAAECLSVQGMAFGDAEVIKAEFLPVDPTT